MVFKKIKDFFSNSNEGDLTSEDYLELNLGEKKEEKKVLLKLFVLKDYEDTTQILEYIRQHYTIALIDIKKIKQKDPIELKRAVNKIRKTIDAIGGSIAGYENMLIAAPSFVKISKPVVVEKKEAKEF